MHRNTLHELNKLLVLIKKYEKWVAYGIWLNRGGPPGHAVKLAKVSFTAHRPTLQCPHDTNYHRSLVKRCYSISDICVSVVTIHQHSIPTVVTIGVTVTCLQWRHRCNFVILRPWYATNQDAMTKQHATTADTLSSPVIHKHDLIVTTTFSAVKDQAISRIWTVFETIYAFYFFQNSKKTRFTLFWNYMSITINVNLKNKLQQRQYLGALVTGWELAGLERQVGEPGDDRSEHVRTWLE